jgi:hypothetical protein
VLQAVVAIASEASAMAAIMRFFMVRLLDRVI